MVPIHGRMRQHDLETVIKCVFSVFNTPNATSATMVDYSKKPVTMTVTVSQSQSVQQRQPITGNRHFPRIFGTIKAQSDKQRMVGPKQNVAGSNPVSPTKTVRNKGVSVGLKPFSGFRYKQCKHGTTSLTSVLQHAEWSISTASAQPSRFSGHNAAYVPKVTVALHGDTGT